MPDEPARLPCGRAVGILARDPAHEDSCERCRSEIEGLARAVDGWKARALVLSASSLERGWSGLRSRLAPEAAKPARARQAWRGPRRWAWFLPLAAAASVGLWIAAGAGTGVVAHDLLRLGRLRPVSGVADSAAAAVWIEALAAAEAGAQAPDAEVVRALEQALVAFASSWERGGSETAWQDGVRRAWASLPARKRFRAAAASWLVRAFSVSEAAAARDTASGDLGRSLARSLWIEATAGPAGALAAWGDDASEGGSVLWHARLLLRCGRREEAVSILRRASGQPGLPGESARSVLSLVDAAGDGPAGLLRRLRYEEAQAGLSSDDAGRVALARSLSFWPREGARRAQEAAARMRRPVPVLGWRFDPPAGWRDSGNGDLLQPDARPHVNFHAWAKTHALSDVGVYARLRVRRARASGYHGVGVSVRGGSGGSFDLRVVGGELQIVRRSAAGGAGPMTFLNMAAAAPVSARENGVPFPLATGELCHLRFVAESVGQEVHLWGRAWRGEAGEPDDWQIRSVLEEDPSAVPREGAVGVWAYQCTADLEGMAVFEEGRE